MTPMHQPSKQQVRNYLERRQRDAAPPPTPDEIRRQLGWGMTAPDFRPSLPRS